MDNQNQAAASNTAGEARRIASVDVVKATPQQVDIPGGGSADTTLNLKIQNGYHVNANPPSYPYLKATELDIPSSSGISVGFISYPTPITKKFSFAEGPLAVYEGETTLFVIRPEPLMSLFPLLSNETDPAGEAFVDDSFLGLFHNRRDLFISR